ncbi:MAG: phage recombination protein Bet [Dehalococcoidia bacterium]
MSTDLANRTEQQENAITWDSSHGEMSITMAECREYFCPTATDNEIMMFLKLCQYQHLNPFLREAYLVKYGEGEDGKASIIVGKEVFTKRAMTIDDCEGFEAGIVIARPQSDGSDPVMMHIEGAMKLPDDILIGGYSKVRSASRGESYHAVALEEYIGTKKNGDPTKFWLKMPSTMIRKVALVQGLREMYPADFQGLYDATEMDAVPNAIEGSSRVINDDRGTRVSGAGSPGKMATADGPDLGDCPVHHRPWVVKADNYKKNFWMGFHPMEGGPLCKLKDVYETLTKEAFAARVGEAFNQKQFNEWLKVRCGGTWSQLSDERKLEAYARCRVSDDGTGEVIDGDKAQRAMDDAAAEEGAGNYDREVEADQAAQSQQAARETVTDPKVAEMFAMSDQEKAKSEGQTEPATGDDPKDYVPEKPTDDVDTPF